MMKNIVLNLRALVLIGLSSLEVQNESLEFEIIYNGTMIGTLLV
jgi:hypothetical protein